MRKYLNVSVAISKIALRYIPPEDFTQYSIDEFLWMLLIAIIDLVLQYMHFAKDLNVEIYENRHLLYCGHWFLICY